MTPNPIVASTTNTPKARNTPACSSRSCQDTGKDPPGSSSTGCSSSGSEAAQSDRWRQEQNVAHLNLPVASSIITISGKEPASNDAPHISQISSAPNSPSCMDEGYATTTQHLRLNLSCPSGCRSWWYSLRWARPWWNRHSRIALSRSVGPPCDQGRRWWASHQVAGIVHPSA